MILESKIPDRLIISHLNVNALRNKFEFLVPLVKDNVAILMLSETKLDSSFPHAQFSIEGYSKPYRFFFFSIWVFFYEYSRITGLQGKGEGISLTPHYHFHPLHRRVNIGRVITAESSPLHTASSRNRTGNLLFPNGGGLILFTGEGFHQNL